ncbi:MAG TPA: ribonuclease P protein component [Flavisolibacter sp.]|nr:ribonuclease P protein component [Flavisolibacter sp.]
MAKRYGFGKREKLKSRKQIDDLFAKGRTLSVFPLRVTYRFMAGDGPVLQTGVSAGKRYFKRAVDRNRIKRLMREAYRLQKERLMTSVIEKKMKGFLFFAYSDTTIAPFETIRAAMLECLNRLEKKLPEQ